MRQENQNFKIDKTPQDIIILNICTINDNHIWLYSSWDMEHNRQIFLSFWIVFCPFIDPENQNFGKTKKKIPEDVIILQMCTISDSHMMYGSWDMKCNRQNFLSFWTIFLPFYPPNNPKNQNFEKLTKTPGDIIILHMRTINDNHPMSGSWDIELEGLEGLISVIYSFSVTKIAAVAPMCLMFVCVCLNTIILKYLGNPCHLCETLKTCYINNTTWYFWY